MPLINTGRISPDARNSVAIRSGTGVRSQADVPAGFNETFQASRQFQKREGNLTSAARSAEPLIQERHTMINEVTGVSLDVLESTRYESAGLVNRINNFIDKGEITRDDAGNISANTPKARTWMRVNPAIATVEYAKRDTLTANPQDYLTDERITERTAADLGEKRAKTDAIRQRATTLGGLAGEFAGAAVGFAEDPLQGPALLVGGGPAVGRGVVGNALKAFGNEALIAAALEVPVQTEAFLFKKSIGSPYTLKEAAFNVLAVTLGAGVIRSAGSITIDLAQKTVGTYRARVQAGKVNATPESEQAADMLDDFIEGQKDAPAADPGPEQVADHFEAIDKAAEDINTNQPVDVEAMVDPELTPTAPQEIPGNKIFVGDDVESFDPRELLVDAETFQFKGGGDDLGVTSAFRDIDDFRIEQSGQVIVYEDLAGKRFIVDGHQRMGIARRALEGGQDPASVRLIGVVLRESDGVTRAEARATAAIKNIAEGTGTGLDAAKVFRDLGERGLANMPRLPAAGVIARRGRDLARLNDDSFRAAINEIVPEDQAAIVGELVPDARVQQAAMAALAKAEPANQVQAREIVKQVREAGVVSRETGDLFGDVINESLILERAKVVDRALRELRGAKRTFATLVRQEDTITGTGANVLDRATNEQQVTDNAILAETLQRDAHTRGPISEAVEVAAEKLKNGESASSVNKSFLRDLDAAITRGDSPGREPGRPRAEIAALDLDADNFGLPEPQHTLPDDDPLITTETIDLPGREAFRAERVEAILADGVKVEGRRPVAYFMGGGGSSGKSSVMDAMKATGEMPANNTVIIDPDLVKTVTSEYIAIREAGDSRAANMVHEESSQISKEASIRAREAGFDVIIDKTMGNPEKALKEIADYRAKGYEIRVYGVTVDFPEAVRRALQRAQGGGTNSGRFIAPKVLFNAHKGFSAGWERYIEAADSARLFDNNGDAPVEIAVRADGQDLDIINNSLYTNFVGKERLNAQAKTLREATADVPAGERPIAADRPGAVRRIEGEAGEAGARAGDQQQGPGGADRVPGERVDLAATKVVDSAGEPLVVHHSRVGDFKTFTESGDIGFHFGTPEQARNRAIDKALEALPVWRFIEPEERAQKGILQLWDDDWFIDSAPNTAEGRLKLLGKKRDYILQNYPEQLEKAGLPPSGLPADVNVVSARLSIDNPLKLNKDLGEWSNFDVMREDLINLGVITREQWDAAKLNQQQVIDWIEAAGFDGIIYKNEVEGVGQSYVVFRDNQIERTAAPGEVADGAPAVDSRRERLAAIEQSLFGDQAPAAQLVEESAKEPIIGRPFLVYRFGRGGDTLQGKNAGNAMAVSGYIMRTQDFEAPQQLGVDLSDRVAVFEVTLNEKPGRYMQMQRGAPNEFDKKNIPGSPEVGRAATKDTPTGSGVLYSFMPGANYSERKVGDLLLDDLHARLQQRGFPDFDNAGQVNGQEVVQEATKALLEPGPARPVAQDLAGPVDRPAQALSDAQRQADIRRNGTRDVPVGESDFFGQAGRLEADLFDDVEADAINVQARALLDDTDVEIPTEAQVIEGQVVVSTTSARKALQEVDAAEVRLDDLITCYRGEAA